MISYIEQFFNDPNKHLDLLGTILMLVVGFGWAKPVPVNPRNYRNYRKDDLKVSVAGVTMNAILFVLSSILMTIIVGLALSRVPDASIVGSSTIIARMPYHGVDSLIYPAENSYIPIQAMMQNLPYYPADALIAPVFGEFAGHLYQMLGYFASTNLVLCVFNLLPVPPLDGYHVLNDLVLRRRQLFANPQMGRVLGWVDTQILTGAGNLAISALRAMGLVA